MESPAAGQLAVFDGTGHRFAPFNLFAVAVFWPARTRNFRSGHRHQHEHCQPIMPAKVEFESSFAHGYSPVFCLTGNFFFLYLPGDQAVRGA